MLNNNWVIVTYSRNYKLPQTNFGNCTPTKHGNRDPHAKGWTHIRKPGSSQEFRAADHWWNCSALWVQSYLPHINMASMADGRYQDASYLPLSPTVNSEFGSKKNKWLIGYLKSFHSTFFFTYTRACFGGAHVNSCGIIRQPQHMIIPLDWFHPLLLLFPPIPQLYLLFAGL